MDAQFEEEGLQTREALNRLYVEIDLVLSQFKVSQKNRRLKCWPWIKDTLSPNNTHSTLDWISAFIQLSISLALVMGYCLDGDNIELEEAVIILGLLILNLFAEFYESKLRHQEISKRVQMVLDKMRKEMHNVTWNSEHYPNLHTPMSPCITLQWTYRDGHLVNLPWALLVKGDVILVRPGQISPGYCEAVDKHSENPILHAKEIFAPSVQNANEIFSTPKTRKPLSAKKYRLLETPYLYNLKMSLEEALDRPITQHNQQRHFVMIKVIERIFLPVMSIWVFLSNLFRYIYFHQYLGKFSIANMFFICPSNAILPLLPLVFPIVWIVSNYVGMARFQTIFNATRQFPLRSTTLEEDTETITPHREIKLDLMEVFRNFLMITRGDPHILFRSSNILHVLGSVTALGCIDKKGILSWANPTAEKVFFLNNNDVDSQSSVISLNDFDLKTRSTEEKDFKHDFQFSPSSPVSAIVEVLDLTHTHNDPFKLRFDDHNWQRHISSLKPLGLAVLLNTCNVNTQEHYSNFCTHIACEAVYNENLVPVTNRRCLCELAKEIGFSESAQNIFSLVQQLSVFRHVQPEMVRRDNKYVRNLQMSTRLKFPFPHLFSVVVKELCSENFQLLSEGTADIILDCCVDYWDGIDICPLTLSDRRKIQDFYQRSSLTSYCTAFSYRPLPRPFPEKLCDTYLELPSDSRNVCSYHRSATPTPTHADYKSVVPPQFFSTDSSLNINEVQEVNNSDAEDCFQMLCNQIFIGMVTMQYQALNDMVQLIEQLERACIRFVHFSKENELRSRVFSEKMGLESGWNCHISLLSNKNSHLESSRTMSFSAPSAINLDHSTVKFEPEVEKFHIKRRQSEHQGENFSNESIPIHAESTHTTHDWQSLSCLTDSTEQSAPINFDMSNRAKLPRGIENIRPHIEMIDNVPLLVSLFTDCTSSATREMLHIMQDYQEVVCILGSAQNFENAGIFMQADASIAVEPLFPQVCRKIDVKKYHRFSPTALSCLLNSIACSLVVDRTDPISIYHLVMEARHFATTLWSSVQYWLCCCVVLSFMQVIILTVMLPGLLTTGHNLWLLLIVTPAIAIALSLRSIDSDIMKKPQGKMQATFNWDATLFILWCYGLKFLPTILTVITAYIGILTSHCNQMCSDESKQCRCVFFYIPVLEIENGDTIGGFEENTWTLSIARLIIVFIILLHFVIISMGFVVRNSLFHQRFPWTNRVWVFTILFLVSVQCIYSTITYRGLLTDTQDTDQLAVPHWVLILSISSSFVVFCVNELVKRHEIMVTKRFLKRARLDFGTKLGMNSPF